MLNTTRCNTGHHGIKYWHNMAFFFFFFQASFQKNNWPVFFFKGIFFFNSFMSYKILFFRDLMLTAGCASWTVETLIASPKKRHLCLVLTVSETRCGPFPQHQFTLHTHKYKIVCCPPPPLPIPPSCGSSLNLLHWILHVIKLLQCKTSLYVLGSTGSVASCGTTLLPHTT